MVAIAHRRPAALPRRVLATLLIAALPALAAGAGLVGQRQFTDARNPPAFLDLDPTTQARVDLGHAVFNTQWLPAGAANAARRDGLGPLYNAAACDACHNEGAHGRGPTGDGAAPAALIVQLEQAPEKPGTDSAGDPRYGHTFNTSSIEGFAAEGVVTIRYESVNGRYPDGAEWALRSPHYELSALAHGPLSAHTVVQPRLAPALFGLGLLEAVVDGPASRFGWQARSTSLRDQTTKAFARDMGLTTVDRPMDDCTPAERDCLGAANGGNPEVAPELLDAVVEFQETLAVPSAPTSLTTAGAAPAAAAGLFGTLGCAACHRPTWSVDLPTRDGNVERAQIAPYTDLALHDMGSRLADRNVSGDAVLTRWRTAPLWGMGYRLRTDRQPTFLHDGRARSLEEAILWHGGEAQAAQQHFTALTATQRAALVEWLGTR
jgi:CxxC motif-containing protein (DUF1111 family)